MQANEYADNIVGNIPWLLRRPYGIQPSEMGFATVKIILKNTTTKSKLRLIFLDMVIELA